MIITSNRAPSDWYPLFPNPVVAESLLDRLINTSHQVIMNGPSYRPKKRPKNPTEKLPAGQSWPASRSGPAGSSSQSPWLRTRGGRTGRERGGRCP